VKLRSFIKNILANPLAFVWAGIFTDILNLSILNPFLPQIMLNMGATLGQIGLLFSVNAFLGLFSNLLWGSLSDRFGRKPILLVCRTGTLLGFIILMSARTIPIIFAARIVDGIFSRMEPLGLSIIGDLVPPERRSREMSRIGAAWIIGGLIGPSIGAYAASQGIAKLGYFQSILALCAITLTVFGIKESLPTERTAGNQSHRRGYDIILPTLQLFKKPTPRSLLFQSFFSKLPYFSFMMTASIFMSTRLGLSVVQIGTLLTAINIVNLIIRLLFFSPLLTRIGDFCMMRIGFILYFIGFVWLAFVGRVWEFFAISLLLSFATSCAADVMLGVISKSVRQEQMGGMIGMNSSMESVSLVVGPIVGSGLLSSPFSAGYGLLFTGFILAALAANLLQKPAIPLPIDDKLQLF
jgi:MFS family permease